jgi:hypothetical protein
MIALMTTAVVRARECHRQPASASSSQWTTVAYTGNEVGASTASTHGWPVATITRTPPVALRRLPPVRHLALPHAEEGACCAGGVVVRESGITDLQDPKSAAFTVPRGSLRFDVN